MADLDRINDQIATIEVLEAYRARLRAIEAGEPPPPYATPDELRATIADLEAKVASFPKD